MGKLIQYSRQLRKRLTPAEKEFRGLLTHQCSLFDVYFEFQKIFWNEKESIGYIVDFYVSRCRLVFEIDGGYHAKPEQEKKDAKRDRWLGDQNIKVVRIKNETVSKTEACSKIIFDQLNVSKFSARCRKTTGTTRVKVLNTGRYIDGVEIKEIISDHCTGPVYAPAIKKGKKKKPRGCRFEVPGTFSGSVLWRK